MARKKKILIYARPLAEMCYFWKRQTSYNVFSENRAVVHDKELFISQSKAEAWKVKNLKRSLQSFVKAGTLL